MLWGMMGYLWRHWRFSRSLGFHVTGCTDSSRPGVCSLWVHCDKCHSTGGFHFRPSTR